MPTNTLKARVCLVAGALLCCLARASAAPQASTPRSSSTQATRAPEQVAGKVLDARTGQPLAHALVTLTQVPSNHTVASTYTAEDGTYRFEPVTAGKYRLEGASSGHLRSAYLGHQGLSTAIVTGAGLPVNALVLTLMPAASIEGRVVDENGEPVPHAQVSLFREGDESGSRATRPAGSRQVDSNGNFEFYPLQPGHYFLCARGTPWYAVHPPAADMPNARFATSTSIDPALDVAYPSTFYPAALSADGATTIDVAEGDEITANMELVPQHAVSLMIRRPANGQNSAPPQLMEKVFGFEYPVPTQYAYSDQGQTLTGIAPGHYELRSFSNGNRLPVTAGSLDLNSNTVREATPMPELASVTMTVIPSGTDSLPKRGLLTLIPVGQNGPVLSRPINEKGIVELDDLPPGDYRLRLAGNKQPNLAVGALTVSGHPVPDQRLHIRDASHLVATATLSGAPVTVQGWVRQDGKGIPGTMVVLVPAGTDTEPELFRRDQSDLDGSFSIPDVAPGHYLLIALEDAWTFPWTDLHALTPLLLHAQPVVVPGNGASTLELPGAITPQPRP